MNSVIRNPFRVLGICPTASQREIANAKSEMMIYSEMGKTKSYWHDSVLPGEAPRSPEDIENAANQIEKPSEKLLHALFWFWENSKDSIDEMAFDLLKDGNSKRAREFWVKGTSSEASFIAPSNCKNLVALDFALIRYSQPQLQVENLSRDISLMGEFFNSSGFHDYCQAVLGDGSAVDIDQVIKNYTELLIKDVSKIIDIENLGNFKIARQALSLFPHQAQSILIDQVLKGKVTALKGGIEKYKFLIDDDEVRAISHGLSLHENTAEEVGFLSDMVDSGDLQYQSILDKYFNTLLQAAIAGWNSNDVSEGSKICNDILQLENIIMDSTASQVMLNKASEQFGVMHGALENEKKLKPLMPLIDLLNNAHEKSDNSRAAFQYDIAKNFVFGSKKELDRVKKMYADSEDFDQKKTIASILSNCAIFVNQCGVSTANENSEYGRAIELVDMARRILLYTSGYNDTTIDEALSNQLSLGRRTLANNISNSNGLLGMAIGGGIRVFKKNTKCGCGSGRNLNECCSV
jgi:hypothetical protein